MSSYARTDHNLREKAFSDAEKRLRDFKHEVHTYSDEHFIRHVRARCRDGSSQFSHHIAEYSSALVVTGDMGEWVWVRCTRMFDWARSAWKSDSYFAEKIMAHQPGELKEFWLEGAEQHVFSIYKDSLPEGKAEAEEFMRAWNTCVDMIGSVTEFQIFLIDHCPLPFDELPLVERYTYRFHWIQRAIGYVCENVLPEKTVAP